MPYLMPNGKWRGKRMINGQVKTKVFSTKQDAKKWEAAQEASDWEAAQNSTTRTVCLHDFANAYLNMASERFAQKTFAGKKLAFKYLFRTIPPTTKPEDFTPHMALDALRAVVVTSSGHAANKARKNLMAAWEWGKKYNCLPIINPFREVDKFPADEKPRYVPPESDFWKAFHAASPDDQTFLLFMLHTGARRSEVFRLRWDDVDLINRKVRLGTRKTGHGGMEYAWVPLTTSLHDLLAMRRITQHSAHVFIDPATGNPYSARQHFMERLCVRAGVKPFGFHAVRHLAATILAYGGLDIPSIQAVLRHHNPNTTARYIKSLGVQPDKLDSIFENRKTASKVVSFKAVQKAIGT